MRKRIFASLLLAALLLTVGCAEETPSVPSDSSEPVSAAESVQSAASSAVEFSLPEETTVEESILQTSSGSIELPPAPVFSIRDGLQFCPAEGWEENTEHVYTSDTGDCTVRVDFLTLPDPKGVTEVLLVDDALQTLPDALAHAGAEILVLESVVLAFLDAEHPTVSLVAVKNGKTVYQQQLYLLDGEQVLLLTVTSQTEDKRDILFSYFKQQ